MDIGYRSPAVALVKTAGGRASLMNKSYRHTANVAEERDKDYVYCKYSQLVTSRRTPTLRSPSPRRH